MIRKGKRMSETPTPTAIPGLSPAESERMQTALKDIAERSQKLEQVGAQLRAMMPFLDAVEVTPEGDVKKGITTPTTSVRRSERFRATELGR